MKNVNYTYAQTSFTNRHLYPDRGHVNVYMHRAIIWCPDGREIDHIDGNQLDNRKHNLRSVDKAQNQWNRKEPINNTSGSKGVSWSGGKWVVEIVVRGKKYCLGRTSNMINATIAYRLASKVLHGEYSVYWRKK